MSLYQNRHFWLAVAVAYAFTCTELAFAQNSPAEASQFVRLPRQELDAIQQELRYLRERDTQRQATDDAIMRRLDDGHVSARGWDSNVSSNSVLGDPGSTACCQACGNDGCCCGDFCLSTPEAPCVDCPRVTTLNPYYNVRVFGNLTTDMLFSSRRPVSPGTPYFLAPALPGSEATFDLHARQSTIGAALTGPQVGDWQTGGTVVGIFYNDNVLADKYGLLPLQAFGEMRNDAWRFAAGLQFDVFNPLLPTILPFSALSASGNSGNAFRGQVRLERFITVNDDAQWTVQAALSEPITTTISPTFEISEDNGWPNIEGRLALGLGELGTGAAAQRPFEIGVSGIVGQLRTTPIPPAAQVVTDVWGLGSDLRYRVNDIWGFSVEAYTGQGLGTYNGAILQTVNTDTFRAIRSTGGWCETYVYLTPCLHSHVGYGIDDPRDDDVSINPASLARIRNETYFANLLWDVNQAMRVGLEFTWRETAYSSLPDNEGAGCHMQFRWGF